MNLTRWEYKVVQIDIGGIFFGPSIESDDLAYVLNQKGAEGWELVNMLDINTGQGRTNTIVLTFKRPVY